MGDVQALADRFDAYRPHLRSVAYRMLGSISEAEDAVQEAWLRASGADADGVDNLGGWLTTIVSRVSLNMLRSRSRRPEDPIGLQLPDPIVGDEGPAQPEEEAVLADAVSVAMLVVLENLSPAERVAFVLHDTFGMPFDEVASVIDRSPTAARQLASRARRRVRDAEVPAQDPDRRRQRAVVDAFFRATRAGDFNALLRILDPDVMLRADFGPKRAAASTIARGVPDVSRYTRWIPGSKVYPVLVNGSAGVVITVHGRPHAVMGFTVVDDRIVAIDGWADAQRVRAVAGRLIPGLAGA